MPPDVGLPLPNGIIPVRFRHSGIDCLVCHRRLTGQLIAFVPRTWLLGPDSAPGFEPCCVDCGAKVKVPG